jgi:hypothetical protein
MPLVKSASKKAFSQNVKKEMESGRPQKQALAIAYATRREAEKKSGKKAAVKGRPAVKTTAMPRKKTK